MTRRLAVTDLEPIAEALTYMTVEECRGIAESTYRLASSTPDGSPGSVALMLALSAVLLKVAEERQSLFEQLQE